MPGPSLAEFLEAAKPLNPDASEAQLTQHWAQTYSDVDPSTLPTLQTFLPAAKAKNPTASDADLRDYWQSKYGIMGAAEKDPPPLGMMGTLAEGAKSAGRSLKAAGQTYLGDEAGVVQTAQDQQKGKKDPALQALLSDIQKKKDALGSDPGWLESIGAVGSAALSNPKGAAYLLAEQLPNSAVSMGSGLAGAAAGGAMAGPVGAVVGGLAGLFGANTLLETGAKSLEAAQDHSFGPEEQTKAIKEGTVKGAVVSAFDAASLGLTKWFTGAATRAAESATAKTLTDRGIDVADEAAVQAAKQNPEIFQAVQAAQKRAVDATTTLGQKLARGSGVMATEVVGEGAGEYLGEYAATGQGDKVEAIIEALAGLGQSAGDVIVSKGLNRKDQNAAMLTGEPPPLPAPTPPPPDTTPTVPGDIGPQLPSPQGPQLPQPFGPNLPEPLGPTIPQPAGPSLPEAVGPMLQQTLGPSNEPAGPYRPTVGKILAATSVDDAIQSANELVNAFDLPARKIDLPRPGYEVPTLPAAQQAPAPLITPGQAFTSRPAPTLDPREAIALERAKLAAMRPAPRTEEVAPIAPGPPTSDAPLPSAAELAYPASERDRMPSQADLLLRQNRPLPRGPEQPTILPGQIPPPADSPIVPGQAFTPRSAPELTAKERIAAERAKLLAQRPSRPTFSPEPQSASPKVDGPPAESLQPLPTAADKIYPSVQQLHTLATSKGMDIESPVFKEFTQLLTGKAHLDSLTPQERQTFATRMEKLKGTTTPFQRAVTAPKRQSPAAKLNDWKSAQAKAERPTFETITPSQDTPVGENVAGEKLYERANGQRYRMRTDRKDRPHGYPDFGGDLAPTDTTPDVGPSPDMTAVPRSALPPEQNAEMLLRAEKAQADLEIAGKERGGRFFIEQHGQGSTPDVRGLKSATADWYKELTKGQGKLSKQQIEIAVQKIIKDEGSDVGKAVERVKQALLQDNEFRSTPWGEDADSIMRGEWPSWIQKPDPTTGHPYTASLFRGEGLAPQEAAKNRIPSQYAVGEHWSPDRDVAESYGPNVRTKEVSLQNPYVFRLPRKRAYFEELEKEFGTHKPDAITKQLQAKGHDGLIVLDVPVMRDTVQRDKVAEIIVFKKPEGPSTVEERKARYDPDQNDLFQATPDRPKRAESPKAEQLSIDIPPPTSGERPIIGREATHEEAPLFSKAAQQAEPEQQELTPTEILADALRTAADRIGGKAKAKDPDSLFELKAPYGGVTETPAFKKWFGDSKVVDEDGKPLVVYHGTRAEDFDVFDAEKSESGFHFGPQSQAKMRQAKKQIAAYLMIENPRRSRDDGGGWKAKIKAAKAAGHDGIIYLNRYEGISLEEFEAARKQGLNIDRMNDAQFRRAIPSAQDSYIAFQPTQIKSATGNSGAFDPKNPSIVNEPSSPYATDPAPSKRRVITDEMKAEALRLYNEGLPTEEIGLRLNMNAGMVSRYARELGAPSRRLVSDDARAEILKSYDEGKTVNKIAQETGKDWKTVWNVLTDEGHAVPKPFKHSQDVRDEAVRLYSEEKMSRREVANRLGIPASVVQSAVRAADAARSKSEAAALASAKKGAHPIFMSALWHSTKTGKWEWGRSSYELVRMSQLDNEPTVKRWTRAIDPVPYGDGRNYLPDFLVEYNDGAKIVEEVKPASKLTDEDVEAKAAAATAYFQAQGIGYRIVTEDEIGADSIKNFDYASIPTLDMPARKAFQEEAVRLAKRRYEEREKIKRLEDKVKVSNDKNEAIAEEAAQDSKDGLTESQQLFENSTRYELRPGEQQTLNFDLARQALGALDRAGTDVSATSGAIARPHRATDGIRTVALGITPDLINQGPVSLTGYRVTSAEDLAKLAQVYRDPRFETFRIFYTKGGEIVGHEGRTSRLPGTVKVFKNAEDRLHTLRAMRERMKALKADGYYMLHNHPSGESKPSTMDVDITRSFAAEVPGFQGHVVIDSDEYSHIGPEHVAKETPTDWETKPLHLGPDALLTPSIPHPLLRARISGPGSLADFGKALQSPTGYATLIYRASNARTRAIQEIPVETLADVEKAAEFLASQGVAFGSSQIFSHYAAQKNDPILEKLDKAVRTLIDRGLLLDHVTEDSTGIRQRSLREQGVLQHPDYTLGKKFEDIDTESVAEPGRIRTGTYTAKIKDGSIDVTVERHPEFDGSYMVSATKNGEEVGSLSIGPNRFDEKQWSAMNLSVDSSLRRQRIGTALYDAAYSAGIRPIVPDTKLSDDSRRLWESRRQIRLGEKPKPLEWKPKEVLKRKAESVNESQSPYSTKAQTQVATSPVQPLPSRARFTSDLTPAQAASLARIHGTPKAWKDKLADFQKTWKRELVQGLFDQYAPILDYSKKGYMLARMAKAGDGTLEALLLYGKPMVDKDGAYTVDYKEGSGMQGFSKVLSALQGEHDRFLEWVAAQRAGRLKSVGLENLYSEQDIATLKTLNQGKLPDGQSREAAYLKALNQLNDWNDAMVKIAVDSGLISPETRELYKNVPYVPFYRLQEEGVIEGFGMTPGLVNQYAWKKLKGGTEHLNDDLLANLLQNWSHLITASAKNRAAKETLDAAKAAGVAEQIPSGAPGKGHVAYLENGTAKTFTVSDPLLFDAVASLHYAGLGSIAKPFQAMKRALSFAVTVNPAYKIRNLLRDTIQAIGTSELSYNPLKNLSQGAKATQKQSETRAQLLAGGGMMRFGSMLDGTDTSRTRRLIESGVDPGAILSDAGAIQKVWKKMIQPAFEAYQEFGDRGEQLNRAALYEQLKAKGMSHQEAAFWARDLMDFSMSGKWAAVRVITQIVPFVNARLQGLFKLGRASQQDRAKLATTLGAVALASIGLMLAYQDDEDWKKREDFDRENYWWFKIGTTALRIPKPFEIGVLGTIAERSVEYLTSHEMTGERFGKRLAALVSSQLSMNPTPQLLKPLMDLYANKDAFTGRPIETPGMERVRKSERFTEKTSETARFLGGLGLPDPAQLAMGRWDTLSPVQVDSLVRGYFSWLGTTTTTALDYGIRPMLDRGDRPDLTLKDVFLAGNFVESLPAGSSRYLTEFYAQANEIEQAYGSFQAAKKRGDLEGAKEIFDEEKDKIGLYRTVEHIKRTESKLNERIKMVESSRTMTGEQKRALIDSLREQKHRLAKQLSDRKLAMAQ